MILLKYARLLPPDATENIWGDALNDSKAKDILEKRTKEFVVCGYKIDAKDAVLMTDEERATLYLKTIEWEKEKLGLGKLLGTEGKQSEFWSVMPSMPIVENDRICDYLGVCVQNA